MPIFVYAPPFIPNVSQAVTTTENYQGDLRLYIRDAIPPYTFVISSVNGGTVSNFNPQLGTFTFRFNNESLIGSVSFHTIDSNGTQTNDGKLVIMGHFVKGQPKG
jgi:hypothetical protein